MKNNERKLFDDLKANPGEKDYAFISYAHKDNNTVLQVVRQMQNDTCHVWFDEGIKSGAIDFNEEIERYLKNAEYVLFFTSQNFWASTYCQKEFYLCIKEEIDFLTIMLDGTEVPQILKFDLHDTWMQIDPGKEYEKHYAKKLEDRQNLVYSNYSNKITFFNKLYSYEKIKPIFETKQILTDVQRWKSIFPMEENKILEKPTSAMCYGDRCKFGRYYIKDTKEKDAITWCVIGFDEKEKKYLLLSEKLLDAKDFNDSGERASWQDSSIRKWLNGSFYDLAFNEDEKKQICLQWMKTLPNVKYAMIIPDGENQGMSEDHVFLLSIEDIYEYFSKFPEDRNTQYRISSDFLSLGENAFLQARYTEYGLTRTCYPENINSPGWWWLRSSGKNEGFAARITSTPEMNLGGATVVFPKREKGEKPAGGIRPAIWIRVD